MGDTFIVNGAKRWISNGGEADLYLLYCRMSDDLGSRAIGSLIVPASTPGVTFGAQEKLMGFRGIPSSDIYFDDVESYTPPLQLNLYDLDNIQVLKGPQGGAFGKSTIGGAVLFVSKKPTNDFSGYVDLKGACKFLSVGESQFKEWVRLGYIHPRKVSSHLVRYRLQELVVFMEEFLIKSRS